MIQTKHLKKIFSKDKKIQFSDVSLPDASVLFVQGPSGAGKTTLMKILAKLDTQFEGTYETDFKTEEIGYFFHTYKLIPSLSVEENIALGNVNKYININKIDGEIQELAQYLGVKSRLSTPIRKLSSGEYQRMCLIRTFVGNKKLILLDEPTSHLDDETSHLVHERIFEYYKKGVVFIISSHDRSLFDFLQQHIQKENIIQMKL